MKVHYYTEQMTILCNQKHRGLIRAIGRFSYKIGEYENCKNCDRILKQHQDIAANKCLSLEKLGYKTDCKWRDGIKCNCIDDCNLKTK